MKNQQFRFKLAALLLMGLIALAGVLGIQNLPAETQPGPSLRDAILRLTGQATPTPADSPQPAETLAPGSFSEALSNYFSSQTETPADTPQTTETPRPTETGSPDLNF